MLFSYRSFRSATTVLALTAMAACSSSKKDDPTPTTPAGMSWTVDGAAVSTTTVQSHKGSSTVSIAANTISGNTYVYLGLEIPNAVGTYTFSSSALAAATYSVTSGAVANVYYAGTLPSSSGMSTIGAGTIVVTALTATNVTGTFTFTGIGPAGVPKSITNGTFNVGL